ncbi:MAG TPA: hypothetical protein VNA32_04325, partial [Actinomycetota bacterium]|nr:hypothetical protein [Actinomycetota bacterium]
MSRVQFESEEPVAVGWWRRPLSSPPAQDGAHAAAQADAVADRVESVVQQAFPDLWAELTDAGRAHLVGTLLTAKHPGERGRVVAGW